MSDLESEVSRLRTPGQLFVKRENVVATSLQNLQDCAVVALYATEVATTRPFFVERFI
jgi:hypothetical protein